MCMCTKCHKIYIDIVLNLQIFVQHKYNVWLILKAATVKKLFPS